MENEKKIELTRDINALPEKVWQAWTDPKVLTKWWGPDGVTTPICDIDLRVGGEINTVMLAGKELGALAGQRWPMRGIFEEIIPNKRLVFKNNAVDESGNILIEGKTIVILEPNQNATKLTMISDAKGRVPQTLEMIGGMEMGWSQSLDKLVKLFN